MDKHINTNKIKIIVIAITIITKILGFARDLVLSFCFGATNISDAYLIATTLPVSFFTFVGVAISSSFMPISNEIKEEKEQKLFVNRLLYILILFSFLIIILINIFPSYIIKLFASGFEGEVLEISKSMLRVSIFSVLFSNMIFLFTAYLNYNNRFIITAIKSLPLDIIIIFSIYFSYKTNKLSLLSLGVIIAILFEFIILIPSTFQTGFRVQKVTKLFDSNIKKMIYLSMPAIIGSSISEINTIIDRNIASRIEIGGISALTYSSRIINAVISIFVTTIISIAYPMIVKISNNEENYKKIISKTINEILFLTIPISVFFVFFSYPIINIIFNHGEITEVAFQSISNAFKFYSMGIVFIGLRDFLIMIFYSKQKTLIPTIVSLASMIINIVLNIILSKYMGIKGLALATSISTLVSTLLLIVLLFMKKIFRINNEIIFELIKNVFSAVIMVILLMLLNKLLISLNQVLSIIILCTTGFIIYVSTGLLFNSKICKNYLLFKKRSKE